MTIARGLKVKVMGHMRSIRPRSRAVFLVDLAADSQTLCSNVTLISNMCSNVRLQYLLLASGCH